MVFYISPQLEMLISQFLASLLRLKSYEDLLIFFASRLVQARSFCRLFWNSKFRSKPDPGLVRPLALFIPMCHNLKRSVRVRPSETHQLSMMEIGSLGPNSKPSDDYT